MFESTIRSAITSPQARQVVGWKTKLGRKLPKLVGPQSFGEDVSCLKIGIDVLKVDIPCKDTFSIEVVVHLNVLYPSMEDGVSNKMNTFEIVTVEQDWTVDGEVQILKYPLEPYDFTYCNNRAPVFDLCAQQCNNRPLFTAPWYCSVVEGENKIGGRSSIGLIVGPVGIHIPFESNWRGLLIEYAIVRCSTHES